jgi:hypothetical protein
MLLRLKVAAALSALSGGSAVLTPDDWRLAGLVMATSATVRTWVLGRISAADERAEAARNARRADTAAAEQVGRKAADAAVVRVARVMGRHVRRHECESPPCDRRHLWHAVASRDRHLFEAAVAEAIELGEFSEDDLGNLATGDPR